MDVYGEEVITPPCNLVAHHLADSDLHPSLYL